MLLYLGDLEDNAKDQWRRPWLEVEKWLHAEVDRKLVRRVELGVESRLSLKARVPDVCCLGRSGREEVSLVSLAVMLEGAGGSSPYKQGKDPCLVV